MTQQINDQKIVFLVCAVYDFYDVQEGEIKLAAGDVISVSKDVDENWWQGMNLSQTGVPIVGNFPKSFVKELSLPVISSGDRLLLSTLPFQTDVPGDLHFGANEVIVLEDIIDDDWYQGSIGDSRGIFPKSFTKSIHQDFGISETTQSLNDFSSLPSKETRKPLAVGLAVMDFEARLEDEISFRDGDTIEIFEVCDSSLVLGSNKSNPNKVGRLPLEFVFITEGEENLNIKKTFSKFNWWMKPEAEDLSLEKLKKQQENDRTVPSFEEQTSLLTTGDQSNSPTSPCKSSNDMMEISSNDSLISLENITDDLSNSQKMISFGECRPTSIHESTDTTDDVQSVTQSNVDYGLVSLEVDNHGDFHSNLPLVYDVNIKEDKSKDGNITSSSEPPSSSVPLSSSVSSSVPLSSSSMLLLPHDINSLNDCQFEVNELIKNQEVNDDYDDDDDVNNNNNNNNSDDDDDEGNNDNNINPTNDVSSSKINDASLISFKQVATQEPERSSKQTINFDEMTSKKVDCPSSSFSEQEVRAPNAPPKLFQKPEKPNPLPRCPDHTDRSKIVKLSVVLNDKQHHDNTNANNKKPPPNPNKPKVKFVPQKSINVGIGGFLFKATGHNSSKRKSQFYVDTFSDVCSPASPTSSVHWTSGSVVTFHKLSEEPTNKDVLEDGRDLKNPREIEASCDTTTDSSPRRQQLSRPEHPTQPNGNLSGSGALMTGPLDPERLVSSSPSSSPPKKSEDIQRISSPGKGFAAQLPSPAKVVPVKPLRSLAVENYEVGRDLKINGDDDDDEGEGRINESIVKDIEKRIAETEQDLEKCIMEQSSILNEKYENEGLSLSREASDNLRFYQDNILGLTDELTQLRAILREIKPDFANHEGEVDKAVATTTAMSSHVSMESLALPPPQRRMKEKIERRKKEEQRMKAVEELVRTEADYLQAMCTCYDVFFHSNPSIECPSCIDLEFLFGNMHEVIDLSQRFYNLLEASTNGKEFHEQTIGSCFLEVGEELKRVHGVYCRNHDDVINALTRLELNTEAQAYFREQLKVMRSKMMVFDLGAILIKPVQRIMKYPLLIGELIKNTEEDHLDMKQLRKADIIMKKVALHINEYKRRKDLVLKYKRPIDCGFSKKISKLTVHSIKKKFNRFMTPAQSLDESFSLEENKFKEMNVTIRNLIRDINHYLDFLQVSLMDLESFSNEISDHCSDDNDHKKDLLNMEEAYSNINNIVCSQFKDSVENDIIPILNSLLAVYQGPREVIRKRQHKLLDMDNALIKIRSINESELTKPMKDELDLLRRTYEAMNCQLLEDLPIIYQLSVSVIRDCVRLLAQYQTKFVKRAKKELVDLLDLDFFRSSSSSSATPQASSTSSSLQTSNTIINEFTLLHLKEVDRLSKLSFIPRSFDPSKVSDGHKGGDIKLSLQPLTGGVTNNNFLLKPQTDDERSKVLKTFQSEKLRIVFEDFTGGQILDLCLNSGTLVGVIKEEDPMKNKERLFVCNGAQKGFVLRSHLKPFEAKNQDETRSDDQSEIVSQADHAHNDVINNNDSDKVNNAGNKHGDDDDGDGSSSNGDDDGDDDDDGEKVSGISHDIKDRLT